MSVFGSYSDVVFSVWHGFAANMSVSVITFIYKSVFTKLVVEKKRKNIHTYKYGEKQQNKTKYSEQVCHSVVVCCNANADTSLLC